MASNGTGGSDRNNPNFHGKPAASSRRNRGGSFDEASNNTNNNNDNNINISMRERSERNNDNDNNHRPPSAAAAAASAPSRPKAGTGWLPYAAAARDNNNEDAEEDGTLKRLLRRLKREHISNFGKHSGANSRPNEQRARYLLEASAGNVGLAAALYWEDYIQNRGDDDGENVESTAAAESASSVARKRSREENNSSSSSATTAGAVAAAKKPARRETGGLKNNDDDNNNNGDASNQNNSSNKKRSKLSSMRQFQELGEKLSSLQERLSSLSDNPEQRQLLLNNNNSNNNNDGGADINVDEMLAAVAAASSSTVARGGAAAGRRSSNADSNVAAAAGRTAAGGGGVGADGAVPLPFANMNAAQPPAAAAAQGPTAAAAMYPNIMRLGLSEGELNGNLADALDSADASLAVAAAARAEWMGAGAMFGSTRGSSAGEAFNAALAAALQGEQLLPRYLMHQQQGGGGGGGGEAGPHGGVWGQIVSRALANPGRQLESDEARAFLAALAADSANVGRNNAAVAAAAGGNGGNPNDGGDNDDDNDSMGDGGAGGGGPRDERDRERDGWRENGNADDNNAEAPLRRSLRLRSARRRDAARAVAMEIANRRTNRRANRRNNAAAAAHAAGEDHNVSGSDDDAFMPGPVPVFRKGASSSATKSDSTPSKRKKLDDLVSPKFRLHGHSDDESDNEYDDDSVDIDDFLYGSEDYPYPSRVLWESFPIENIEGENIRDDDSPRVIPLSWLRSGFKLSKCGNGLAMNEPKEDEWDIIRRSLPQNIRDGPLKGVKSLFPYNCKGVSAMLSLVTALLYSGVSLQKGTISIGVDRVNFDELPLQERKTQFDVRLEDALSALIFVAAKAGAQRCKNKLVEYDKFLARRKMDPEEQSFYLQRRQQLEKRTHLCNVCWWDIDSTTGTTSFPTGKDPIDVNVNNSFTNINDIKSYVRTHLRSFKEPGGCALLLETIIRCHGIEYTEQTFGGEGELLSCNCKESLKHVRNSNACTKHPADDCITPKLLSLLLTGEARASYQNWSGDIFGIGVLRMNNNEPPNNQLLRPIKQIWLCQGDTGYSLLFLKKKKLIGREDSLDQPGKAFHWNCWSSELSSMKISSKVVGAGSVSSTVSDGSEEEGRMVMDSICSKIRSEHRRNLASPWADMAFSSANASRDQHSFISNDELATVKFHPDDEKYYPDQYRRWRFYFGLAGGSDYAVPADAWIPFYRLCERQRLVVEMKLAPRIVALVRSRWPMAEVTDFSPRGQYPIV